MHRRERKSLPILDQHATVTRSAPRADDLGWPRLRGGPQGVGIPSQAKSV